VPDAAPVPPRLNRGGTAPAGIGIVHIGLGAFHRAHQAVYTDAALRQHGGDWGIAAVAPRSVDTVRAVAQQDGLFSVTTLSAAAPQTRVIGSIASALHLPMQAAEILDLLVAPATRVVTLTVTEKAYLTDGAGRLLPDDALVSDLTTDRPPRTVIGLLTRALRRRSADGGAPLALVSCDNLPANGERLRSALSQALGEQPPEWASFPTTMVDRIVPASTTHTYARAAAALGRSDLAAVDAEPFSQWVIEDDPTDPTRLFPGGRPSWEDGGATFSAEVPAYERLKLRMLNGVHSTLAYLGCLAGAPTIRGALALPHMREFVGLLMECDIAPTLNPPAGVSVEAYGASVLDRFANPAIGHRTTQVAMDGSQKLPQRILGTVADRRAAGAEPLYLAVSLAAWIRFIAGAADDGAPLALDDPLAEALRGALAGAGDDPAAQVRAIFGVAAVAPPGLGDDSTLIALVAERLATLRRAGVAGLLASLAS
jgi:fructuronate reductase